jgi:hypothetical protein
MKKSIVLSLAVLTLSSMNLMAGHGGDSFGGAFAGSMVGGIVSGAMTQPREKTVVVERPSYSSTEEENAQLRRENRELRRNLNDLERRLDKLEGRK